MKLEWSTSPVLRRIRPKGHPAFCPSIFQTARFAQSVVCLGHQKTRKNPISPALQQTRPKGHPAFCPSIFQTAQLALFNQRIGYQVKEKRKTLLHPCSNKLSPEDIQFFARRLSNSFKDSIRCMPWSPKRKKTYFTCVATNSAQRTSIFFPVDSSNIESEYARVFIALSSLRTSPWSYLCVR